MVLMGVCEALRALKQNNKNNKKAICREWIGNLALFLIQGDFPYPLVYIVPSKKTSSNNSWASLKLCAAYEDGLLLSNLLPSPWIPLVVANRSLKKMWSMSFSIMDLNLNPWVQMNNDVHFPKRTFSLFLKVCWRWQNMALWVAIIYRRVNLHQVSGSESISLCRDWLRVARTLTQTRKHGLSSDGFVQVHPSWVRRTRGKWQRQSSW